jgi:hypothetical protein
MLGEYMYGNMCHGNRNDAHTLSYVHAIWEFKLTNAIMDMNPMVLSKFNRDKKERSI